MYQVMKEGWVNIHSEDITVPPRKHVLERKTEDDASDATKAATSQKSTGQSRLLSSAIIASSSPSHVSMVGMSPVCGSFGTGVTSCARPLLGPRFVFLRADHCP